MAPRRVSPNAVTSFRNLGGIGGDLAPTDGVRTVDEAFLRAASAAPAAQVVDINAPIPLEELQLPAPAIDTASLVPVPAALELSDDEILSRPLRPAPTRPTLSPVPLEKLDSQWDLFMEWLPNAVRDKIYASKYRSLSAVLATARHQLAREFAPNELLFVAEAFTRLGHPLRERAPGAGAAVDRFRKMRRG